MAVTDILSIGVRGMTAHRKAMQTSTNNISNVNTPGYSRQRPKFESIEPMVLNGQTVGGMGVDLTKVIRIHDQFIERQINFW